ncbi:MAG: hypothetical protein MN733_35300 [Nitrososphaera sp.]|nr:hypothetical protein [Nitrososphaera sp.]
MWQFGWGAVGAIATVLTLVIIVVVERDRLRGPFERLTEDMAYNLGRGIRLIVLSIIHVIEGAIIGAIPGVIGSAILRGSASMIEGAISGGLASAVGGVVIGIIGGLFLFSLKRSNSGDE